MQLHLASRAPQRQMNVLCAHDVTALCADASAVFAVIKLVKKKKHRKEYNRPLGAVASFAMSMSSLPASV